MEVVTEHVSCVIRVRANQYAPRQSWNVDTDRLYAWPAYMTFAEAEQAGLIVVAELTENQARIRHGQSAELEVWPEMQRLIAEEPRK